MDFRFFAIPIISIGFIGIALTLFLQNSSYLPSKYGEDSWKCDWYPIFVLLISLGLCWAWVFILDFIAY